MKADPTTGSVSDNPPVLTVSALSLALKHHVETGFSRVRVRGEISGFKLAGSGHVYFTLKDADAVIDAVCWRTTAQRLSVRPGDGMDVIVCGRLTTFPSRSKYQLVVDTIDLAGEGALLKLLDDRRKALAAEGLFSEDRKRPLPFLPGVIGIVTSPTGAVIRDMLHRFADRFPRRVLLWPVQVQGQGAAEQIALAIAGFNEVPLSGPVPRPEVIIVARGGGSLEDLWAFNEEIVVRAAAASVIPLISAVGHETDVTLLDFAADRRAPTPTAAAEIAVPVRLDLLNQVQATELRLTGAILRSLAERRTLVDGLRRGLPQPHHLLEAACQRLDDRAERLTACFNAHIGRLDRNLHHLAARLASPLRRLERDRDRLAAEMRVLRSALEVMIGDRGHRLARASDLLEGCSYERTLRRGYVLAYGAGGRLIGTIDAIAPGDRLNLRFKDGEAAVRVDARSGGRPRAPSPRRSSTRSDDQGRLL
ncbi:MAG: exodeoxyribonuclease VII large subunit [Rhodospirillales bacterium]|nr:exodeoxyribonuclease VII large subunit [Rhodospirillales bacterium]